VNQKILRYLYLGKKKGHSMNALKQKLLGSSFNEEEIDEAILDIQGKVKFDHKWARNHKKALKMKKPVSAILGEKLGIWTRVKKAFAHPKQLFEETRGEGVWSVLKYQLVTMLVPVIFLSIVLLIFANRAITTFRQFTRSIEPGVASALVTVPFGRMLLFVLILAVLVYIVVVAATFILAGIYHLLGKLVKISGRFSDSYRLFVYSWTPLIFFGWIPFVNFGVFVWSLALTLVGITIVHEVSEWRSFFSYVLFLVGVFVLNVIIQLIFV